MAIALGALFSSLAVKYILPYLSAFVFKKIGYGAMVFSGIALLLSTSQQILKHDKLKVDIGLNDTKIKWNKVSET